MNNIQLPKLGSENVKFIDREQEINDFTEALDRVYKRQPIRTTLFEWYGSPGIGKTALVRKLVAECEERNFPRIWIDFKRVGRDRIRDYYDDPTQLIEDMADDLITYIRPEAWDSFKDELNRYRTGETQPPAQAVHAYFRLSREDYQLQKPAWVEGLRSVMASFISMIRSFDQRTGYVKPVALFFDETERTEFTTLVSDEADQIEVASRGDFALTDWIEEWIISPLSQLRHCIIVWTARRPWRWKKPEIRRRVKSSVLEVFKPESSRQQLIENSSVSLETDLFKKVYTITGGHPGANSVAISELNTWPDPDTQRVSDQQYRLLKAIYEDFIEKYAFANLDKDVKSACSLLAVVRVFDTTMLRGLLGALGDPDRKYDQWTQEQFGELMLWLKQTQLLVWEKGYALAGDLRHIVREYFFVCKPEIFRRANQVALEVYGNWLNRPIENRNMYVIEEVYHLASLQRAGDLINFNDRFEGRLKQYVERINDPESLRQAFERLAGELARDRDLKELEELAPSFRVDVLLGQIDQAMNWSTTSASA